MRVRCGDALRERRRQPTGTVLIAVAGILSVLALMAFALAMILKLESTAARNAALSARAKQGVRDQMFAEVGLLRAASEDGLKLAQNNYSTYLTQEWCALPGPFLARAAGEYATVIEPLGLKKRVHIDDDPPMDADRDGKIDYRCDLDDDGTPGNDRADGIDNNSNATFYNTYSAVDNDGDGSKDEDPVDSVDNDGDGWIDEDPKGGWFGVDLTGGRVPQISDEFGKININVCGNRFDWDGNPSHVKDPDEPTPTLNPASPYAETTNHSPYLTSFDISLIRFLLNIEVNLNGTPQKFTLPQAQAIQRLILAYRYGPDGYPGVAGRDDDGDHNACIVDGLDNDGDGVIDEQTEGIDEPDEFTPWAPKGDDRPFWSVEDLLKVLKNAGQYANSGNPHLRLSPTEVSFLTKYAVQIYTAMKPFITTDAYTWVGPRFTNKQAFELWYQQQTASPPPTKIVSPWTGNLAQGQDPGFGFFIYLPPTKNLDGKWVLVRRVNVNPWRDDNKVDDDGNGKVDDEVEKDPASNGLDDDSDGIPDDADEALLKPIRLAVALNKQLDVIAEAVERTRQVCADASSTDPSVKLANAIPWYTGSVRAQFAANMIDMTDPDFIPTVAQETLGDPDPTNGYMTYIVYGLEGLHIAEVMPPTSIPFSNYNFSPSSVYVQQSTGWVFNGNEWQLNATGTWTLILKLAGHALPIPGDPSGKRFPCGAWNVVIKGLKASGGFGPAFVTVTAKWVNIYGQPESETVNLNSGLPQDLRCGSGNKNHKPLALDPAGTWVLTLEITAHRLPAQPPPTFSFRSVDFHSEFIKLLNISERQIPLNGLKLYMRLQSTPMEQAYDLSGTVPGAIADGGFPMNYGVFYIVGDEDVFKYNWAAITGQANWQAAINVPPHYVLPSVNIPGPGGVTQACPLELMDITQSSLAIAKLDPQGLTRLPDGQVGDLIAGWAIDNAPVWSATQPPIQPFHSVENVDLTVTGQNYYFWSNDPTKTLHPLPPANEGHVDRWQETPDTVAPNSEWQWTSMIVRKYDRRALNGVDDDGDGQIDTADADYDGAWWICGANVLWPIFNTTDDIIPSTTIHVAKPADMFFATPPRLAYDMPIVLDRPFHTIGELRFLPLVDNTSRNFPDPNNPYLWSLKRPARNVAWRTLASYDAGWTLDEPDLYTTKYGEKDRWGEYVAPRPFLEDLVDVCMVAPTPFRININTAPYPVLCGLEDDSASYDGFPSHVVAAQMYCSCFWTIKTPAQAKFVRPAPAAGWDKWPAVRYSWFTFPTMPRWHRTDGLDNDGNDVRDEWDEGDTWFVPFANLITDRSHVFRFAAEARTFDKDGDQVGRILRFYSILDIGIPYAKSFYDPNSGAWEETWPKWSVVRERWK